VLRSAGNRYQAEPEARGRKLIGLIGPAHEEEAPGTRRNLVRCTGYKNTASHHRRPPQPRAQQCNSHPDGWLTGVYHARVMNLYRARRDRQNCPDRRFNGTRWDLQRCCTRFPVAQVICCPPAAGHETVQGATTSAQGVTVKSALRTSTSPQPNGDKLGLHVANMNTPGATSRVHR